MNGGCVKTCSVALRLIGASVEVSLPTTIVHASAIQGQGGEYMC